MENNPSSSAEERASSCDEEEEEETTILDILTKRDELEALTLLQHDHPGAPNQGGNGVGGGGESTRITPTQERELQHQKESIGAFGKCIDTEEDEKSKKGRANVQEVSSKMNQNGNDHDKAIQKINPDIDGTSMVAHEQGGGGGGAKEELKHTCTLETTTATKHGERDKNGGNDDRYAMEVAAAVLKEAESKGKQAEVMMDSDYEYLTVAVAGHVRKPPTVEQTIQQQQRQQQQQPWAAVAVDSAAATTEQPRLLRNSHPHQLAQPGAYMGAVGGRLQRTQTLNYDLVGANSEMLGSNENNNISSSNINPANHHHHHHQLAVANPVEEDPESANRMHANPVNLEAQEKRQQELKKKWQTFVFVMILFVLAAAIVIGTLAGTAMQKEKPTIKTPVPTSYGSVEPTGVPSSAPTGLLDLMLEDLPYNTVESLQGFGTPQWEAWEWLYNHQDITYYPDWKKMQLFALASIYFALEGDEWWKPIQESWMDEAQDECRWYSSGFGLFLDSGQYYEFPPEFQVPSCDGLGKFTQLDLQGLQLSGLNPAVPPEVALLTSLSELKLDLCDISAPIDQLLPTAIFQIPSLRELSLLWNLNVTGTIPLDMAMLNNLTYLDLSGNTLSGTIPTELGLLANMNELWAWKNLLTGFIPSGLGLMTNLSTLVLANNFFSGSLPSELGVLNNLTRLHLFGNTLSGVLPTEIGLLTNLEELRVFDNYMTGTLPSEFGRLSLLQVLDLSGNEITGTIPSEVGLMTSLKMLHLQNNSLTGTLPPQLNTTMGLRLDGNQFSGTVPQHLCSYLWCDCVEEVVEISSCADVTKFPAWPGRYPTIKHHDESEVAIVLNIHTLEWTGLVEWVWARKQPATNNADEWEALLDSGGALKYPDFLYSDILLVQLNTTYQLALSDNVPGYPNGWMTLTTARAEGNQSLLFSWDDDDTFELQGDFAGLTIDIRADYDGSVEVTAHVATRPWP